MSEQKRRFSLPNFARVIIKRQIEKNTDTNIVIYGARRTGKTTLGHKVLIPYLTLMRRLYAKELSTWKPPNHWKSLYREYFATSCSDMMQKIKKNPPRSFCFVDEGDDIFSWMNALEREQKDLTQLLLKTGYLRTLNILLVPSMSLFSKAVLSQMHYLLMVPHEPRGGYNEFYVFRNHEQPILKERNPFGFKDIEKRVLKYPRSYSGDKFDALLRRDPCFVTKARFSEIDPKIYALYERMIKDPLVMNERLKAKSVSYSRYKSLEYRLDTLLANLYRLDGKPMSFLEKLLRDKFGNQLMTRNTIQRRLDRIEMMQKMPQDAAQEPEEVMVRESSEIEDVALEDPESEK